MEFMFPYYMQKEHVVGFPHLYGLFSVQYTIQRSLMNPERVRKKSRIRIQNREKENQNPDS